MNLNPKKIKSNYSTYPIKPIDFTPPKSKCDVSICGTPRPRPVYVKPQTTLCNYYNCDKDCANVESNFLKKYCKQEVKNNPPSPYYNTFA